MIPAVLFVVVVVLGLPATFVLGRIAGRNLHVRQLDDDGPYRRQVLERLAQLEGLKIVGRQ